MTGDEWVKVINAFFTGFGATAGPFLIGLTALIIAVNNAAKSRGNTDGLKSQGERIGHLENGLVAEKIDNRMKDILFDPKKFIAAVQSMYHLPNSDTYEEGNEEDVKTDN